MSGNEPDFDPLHASPDEETGMMEGYLAAGIAPRDASCPDTASIAFAHGWRMRRNDMLGVADDDQRELARRASEIQRDAEDRQRRLRSALKGPRATFRP